jgi:hypothetical protein
MPHLFEFMDLPGLPAGLRLTLRDILEVACSPPIRPYYTSVAKLILTMLDTRRYENVVELGAGNAPITRAVAPKLSSRDVRLIPCDETPDLAAYQELQRQYPDRVTPTIDSIDLSKPQDWPPHTLLVLSATLHHIPSTVRARVVRHLADSAERVLITEPLRKSVLALFAVSFTIFPALATPAVLVARPGRARRALWCWLIPIAPLMFVWDGWVSCIRQWTLKEWNSELSSVHLSQYARVTSGPISIVVDILGQRRDGTQGSRRAAGVRETVNEESASSHADGPLNARCCL